MTATLFLQDLLAAMSRAPVTVEIQGPAGQVRVAGTARPAEPPAGDGSHVLSDRFAVALPGQTCELALSVDLGEQFRFARDLLVRAYSDESTGLPNRAFIERSIEALIAADTGPFALAFIDLDEFKRINDFFGHAIGDKLLICIAERLASKLRPDDLLARAGGDEFLLLLRPIADAEDLERDLRWLLDRLKEPFYVDGHEILTSATIGVALYPADGRSYNVLRLNADRAMYSSKGSLTGAVRFFDTAIAGATAERRELEQRLRRAVADDRIRCAYQPKFDFRRHEITGVEVLMRWIDDDGFVQLPGQVLGLATELGLMDEITHRVLDRTVGSIDDINAAFGRHASISFNVSPHQSVDFEFMRGLVNALDRTGFADRFMIELTEEAFLAQKEFQSHVLPLIRSVGARVSIDDFGVGYSSLSSLAAITADEVKVDRSFITDVHRRGRSQSILKAVEALGASLGMSIVVEGVESDEELAYLLSETAISVAQGYRFSRPVMFDGDRVRPGADGPGRPTGPSRGPRRAG